MKKGIFQLAGIVTLLFAAQSFSAELKAINFSQKGEVSELEFILNSNDVEASKFQVKDDRQIIIDFPNTVTTEKVIRAFDTSQFSGGVVFVKAYKKPKAEKDIRVAVQLRDNVRSVLVRKPNKIILQIENRFGVFSKKQSEEGQSSTDTDSMTSKLSLQKTDTVEDILDNIVQAGKKKYIGKKITMNLKNVTPAEILRMIADSMGFNLILSDDVKKGSPVSLSLVETPWDQVLDTVFDMCKLVAKKNGVILIVDTKESALKEEKARKEATTVVKELEPILNRIFPISFADITSLQGILAEYTTEKRGKISVDKRTNSLIVKDTAENIEKMKKMIELLDTQTPQVLIEAKIVEIAEKYSKEIGLANGVKFGYDPFSGAAPAANSGSFSFSTAPDATSALFGLNILKLNRISNLNFQLKLMESESKAKIVTSPKIITKNNVAATIKQTESIWFLQTTPGSGMNPPTNVYVKQDVELNLKVTPQVTNEGSINMTVDINKGSIATSAPGAPKDTTTRSVTTDVLVDNGSTIVIGGIYSYMTTESHSGVPYLKDIPIVGWLFRSNYNPTIDKKELMIFLSPRIINQEEAGLADKG
jgi:type IV pilus assembly protein PilQ